MKTRHPDVPAMVFGLIFMGIAGWYFVDRHDGFNLPSIGWITAGLLILLGIAGISSALRNARE
jgi:putative Mn2+ efflux pump MntP